MAFLRQERQNRLFGGADCLIGNHIQQVGHAQFVALALSLSPISSLSIFGIQTMRNRPPSADDEFPLGRYYICRGPQTRGADTAADGAGQGGELHAAGGHRRYIRG